MDFLDSIEREWSRDRSLRMRSWYLYEQFKDLERSQAVAAELLRSKTEQDRFLRQELNERRERRRLSGHYSQPELARCYSQNSMRSFDNLHQIQYIDFPPSDDWQPNYNDSEIKELIMDEKILDPNICPETLSIPSLIEKELHFHDFQDGLDLAEIEEQCQNLEAELNADSILSFVADSNIKSISRDAIKDNREELEFEKNYTHHNNLEAELNADAILNLAAHSSVKSISRHAIGYNHIEDIKEELELTENDIQDKYLDAELNADKILNFTSNSSITVNISASCFNPIDYIKEEQESAENEIQENYLDAELNVESIHNFAAHSSTKSIYRDKNFNGIEDIREELELLKNDIQDNINIQSNTVLENFNCYSDFDRINEDCKCDNVLEQNKLGDESLQIEEVSSQDEFDSMSETSAVDHQDIYKDFSKHSLWSKIVSYAYHLVQLNHENLYNDYGAQILTAVIVCDMLCRGINRMSDLLQRYVSPIKYDETDQGWQPSGVSNGCVQQKFGAGKKRKRPSQNMEYKIWSPRSSSAKLYSPTCKSSKSKACSSRSNDSGIFVSKFESCHHPCSKNCLISNCTEDFSIPSELNTSRKYVSNPMLKVAEYIDKVNHRNFDGNL